MATTFTVGCFFLCWYGCHPCKSFIITILFINRFCRRVRALIYSSNSLDVLSWNGDGINEDDNDADDDDDDFQTWWVSQIFSLNSPLVENSENCCDNTHLSHCMLVDSHLSIATKIVCLRHSIQFVNFRALHPCKTTALRFIKLRFCDFVDINISLHKI